MSPTSDQIRQQRDARHRTNEQLETEVAERTAELVARSQELEAVNIRLREIDINRAQFFRRYQPWAAHPADGPALSGRGYAAPTRHRPRAAARNA